MTVTDVHIYSIARSDKAQVVALAEVVLDDGLILNDLRIARKKSGGLCVIYPVSQGSFSDRVRYVCNPINADTQRLIEQAVIRAYNRQFIDEIIDEP